MATLRRVAVATANRKAAKARVQRKVAAGIRDDLRRLGVGRKGMGAGGG